MLDDVQKGRSIRSKVRHLGHPFTLAPETGSLICSPCGRVSSSLNQFPHSLGSSILLGPHLPESSGSLPYQLGSVPLILFSYPPHPILSVLQLFV